MPETTASVLSDQQNTIAIVYDFDGTLSPQPMQEYTVLPKLQVNPDTFWQEIGDTFNTEGGELMLTYMRLLIKAIEKKEAHISRQDFTNMGKKIQYFEGVTEWFERINQFIEQQSKGTVNIQHYIISAGLFEIIEGSHIAHHFEKIFASEYHYDHHGVPTFPKLLITDTHKTQFLFRINKGILDLRKPINDHMPENKRPIPFENIIYIGDGDTDVPSMAVVKQQGGHSLAVYAPEHRESYNKCNELLQANRIDFFSKADYSEGGQLDGLIKLILNYVMTKIKFRTFKNNQN